MPINFKKFVSLVTAVNVLFFLKPLLALLGILTDLTDRFPYPSIDFN